MLMLSRLSLSDGRGVAEWVANRYRIHQRLCMAFDEQPRRLLWALPGERTVIVQHDTPADWVRAFSDFPALSGVTTVPHVVPTRQARFWLDACPARCAAATHRRQALRDPVDLMGWFKRKAEAAGFLPTALSIGARRFEVSHKGRGAPQVHYSVYYHGSLYVRDGERFATAVAGGIGPAKGYGFGLLLTMPT